MLALQVCLPCLMILDWKLMRLAVFLASTQRVLQVWVLRMRNVFACSLTSYKDYRCHNVPLVSVVQLPSPNHQDIAGRWKERLRVRLLMHHAETMVLATIRFS